MFRFDASSIRPEFQPWPSIDEVKQRKEQLLKRTPLAFPLPNTAIGANGNEVREGVILLQIEGEGSYNGLDILSATFPIARGSIAKIVQSLRDRCPVRSI